MLCLMVDHYVDTFDISIYNIARDNSPVTEQILVMKDCYLQTLNFLSGGRISTNACLIEYIVGDISKKSEGGYSILKTFLHFHR